MPYKSAMDFCWAADGTAKNREKKIKRMPEANAFIGRNLEVAKLRILQVKYKQQKGQKPLFLFLKTFKYSLNQDLVYIRLKSTFALTN